MISKQKKLRVFSLLLAVLFVVTAYFSGNVSFADEPAGSEGVPTGQPEPTATPAPIKTGIVKENGEKYYYYPDGTTKKGFVKYNGDTYFSGKNGKLRTGWLKYNKKKYYFKKNCKMATGFTKVDKKRYYFLKKGGYKTGWLKEGKNRFYFSKKGVMAIGWTKINGHEYYFYKKNNKKHKPVGAMAKNTTINGKKLDKRGRYQPTAAMDIKARGYSSSTNYLILVDCSIHYVGIYERRNGTWAPKFKWRCTNGKPSTPTVKGSFTTGQKGYYFINKGTIKCYYYTQFCGNYLFHSILYSAQTNRVIDGRLGMALSHGCVRLATENAKWIYNNIPGGTRVIVY